MENTKKCVFCGCEVDNEDAILFDETIMCETCCDEQTSICDECGKRIWSEDAEGLSARLNGVLIDRYAEGESAGYPTLCKGRFEVQGETYYALEEPTSLNVLEILPDIAAELEVAFLRTPHGFAFVPMKNAEATIPLGRGGTPEEAAGAVYLFCIPESDYVSGQVLVCGGGKP